MVLFFKSRFRRFFFIGKAAQFATVPPVRTPMGERLNYANLLISPYQESKGQWLRAGMRGKKSRKISFRDDDDGTTFEMRYRSIRNVTLVKNVITLR
jgi:hypothetical protein